MKTKLLILLVIPILVIFSANQSAQGLWLPQSPEELLEKSQLIFVGNITAVNALEFEQSNSYNIEENGISQTIVENYVLSLDEYTVNVEEFLKNPQDMDAMTVRQPTVSTPGLVVPHGGFDIGDMVLFYVETFDGVNTYSKESFLIPKQCDADSVLLKPRMIGSDFKMFQDDIEKQENFVSNSTITFRSQSDMATLFGASLEYDVYVSKQVGKTYKEKVFHEKIIADAKPCEWLSVAEWEFTPVVGNYLVNGHVFKENSSHSISNKFFSVLPEPPLKQFKTGVSINKIQCKDSLDLILKTSNNSPTCVTSETKIKLIERGWGEPVPIPEPSYTLTEVHCFPSQVIYNDECIYVLESSDEFPKGMTKYFSMVDDEIINFCVMENTTLQDRENVRGMTLDRCFEISSYTISDVNVMEFQSTTAPTWINIKLEGLTRNVELGSSPTFTVVESGWGNSCTSPTLEVYHMKQEIGNDHTDDDLVYKHRIVYSCPFYMPIFPPPDVLRIWDKSDFPNFPICEEQGRYLILGDSGYERLPLDYYYCGIENED